MDKAKKTYQKLIQEIPNQVSEPDILYFLRTREVNWSYVDTIKKLTSFRDDVIADWLNITVKTFRSYKKDKSVFKPNIKEHIIVLLALIKHGIEVFGSPQSFTKWLTSNNFYMDDATPSSLLNTISGVRFVDDRLTALEHGDNV